MAFMRLNLGLSNRKPVGHPVAVLKVARVSREDGMIALDHNGRDFSARRKRLELAHSGRILVNAVARS